MAVIFRKLHQKRHWDQASWLADGEVQADVLKCLSTDENSLSVYILEEPDTQLDRVVAALALNRQYLTQLDWATAPDSVLDECGIKFDRKPGDTGDDSVNEWHEDLVELSFDKLARLARAIRRDGEIKRHNERKVEAAIKASIVAGHVQPDRINPTLVPSLERRQII